jgi:uncharacterized protein (TIGR02391 family)
MQDFSAIDVGAVTAELTRFVDETTPQNASGNGLITARSNPKYGRARAIELAERLRALYAVLYPDWQTDNAESSKDFEFSRERDAAMRLLSRIDAYQEITTMLGTTSLAPQMSANSLHEKVWTAAQAQWQTEHYHEAVLAAAKAVNSLLQAKIRRRDVSEVKLVREAFSERPPTPGKPRLRFPAVADEQTRDSLRQGAMDFGAGCFGAIRNPVGHLPNDEVDLSFQGALERLAALSLLARWVDEAELEVAEEEPAE